MIAMWPGVCWICESTWPQSAAISLWRGEYVHAACVKGDD